MKNILWFGAIDETRRHGWRRRKFCIKLIGKLWRKAARGCLMEKRLFSVSAEVANWIWESRTHQNDSPTFEVHEKNSLLLIAFLRSLRHWHERGREKEKSLAISPLTALNLIFCVYRLAKLLLLHYRWGQSFELFLSGEKKTRDCSLAG